MTKTIIQKEIIIVFYFSALIICGLLFPYSIQWYLRYTTENASTLDYVIIGLFLILTIFLILLSKKVSKPQILVILGLIAQSIGNILLGNLLSLSSTDLRSSRALSFSMFGYEMSILPTSIPLMLFITGGIVSITFGLSHLHSIPLYSLKSTNKKAQLMLSSSILAISLYSIFRSIGGEYLYNLFLISPVASIFGIFSLNLLISHKNNIQKLEDQNEKVNNLKKDIDFDIKSKIISLVFGLINLLLIIISALLNGLSGLALFHGEKSYNIHPFYILSQISTGFIFLIILLIISIRKIGTSKISNAILENRSIFLIFACIITYIQCILAFNPDIEKNIPLQIILSGLIFAFSIIHFLNANLFKNKDPARLIGLFIIIFINSSYITRIPLKEGEIFSEWNIYGTVIIIFFILSILISIISYFYDNKKREVED